MKEKRCCCLPSCDGGQWRYRGDGLSYDDVGDEKCQTIVQRDVGVLHYVAV